MFIVSHGQRRSGHNVRVWIQSQVFCLVLQGYAAVQCAYTRMAQLNGQGHLPTWDIYRMQSVEAIIMFSCQRGRSIGRDDH